MHRSTFQNLLAILIAVFFVGSATAAERPYMIWTAADIAAMKQQLAADADYAARVEQTLADPDKKEGDLLDLWRYAVQDDAEAGERQKKQLLKVARSPVPRGSAQWRTVLRYDLLYDQLSEGERAEVEKFFRTYIDHAVFRNSVFDPEVFNDEKNFSRYSAHYHRINNWLPNIIWPRVVSANLMAAALGDEQLIRKTWDHYGSWRWYFDDYLTDTGFYGEEMAKQHALVGEMLLYCIAVRNIGLDKLGFGYRGRHGATMRGHVESNLRLAYPQVTMHSGLPHIGRMTSGDLRSGASGFQNAIVHGYTPAGEGEIKRWNSPGAWGGEIRGKMEQWDGYSNFTPKMQIPFWFEIAHQQWPQDGYGYFLSLMRRPGQGAYEPSLYFGVEALEPGAVQPPRAPTWVGEQRGLAMLRADESADYWSSPRPAVGFRLAAPYAHDVFDNFVITGFYAFNRPIYINRHLSGYARDWSRSVLSHAGVKVDAYEPAFTRAVTTRDDFQHQMKFLAVQSDALFPDIAATRTLMLTDHYLLDVYDLVDANGQPRTFRWLVHGLGLPEMGDRKLTKRRLDDDLGVSDEAAKNATQHRLLAPPQPLLDTFGQVQVFPGGDDWHLRIVQRSPLPADQRKLPTEWYARQVGVDLRMIGQDGATVAVADTPTTHDPARREGPSEVGGTSVIAHHRAAASRFAALHEPFEGGSGAVTTFKQIKRGDDWAAYRIGGDDQPVNDRAYVRFDNRHELVTVEDDQATVTFADHALVRISPGKVEAFGDVRAIRIKVPADTKYYHNDRLSPATIDDGMLVYNAPRG